MTSAKQSSSAAPPDSGGSDETETTPPSDGGKAISTDMTFEILKNWRRRQVLRYLRSNGGETQLDSLSEHIAALENDIDERALSSSQRKRVYIALYQCHLPKMADVGVIEYEQARGKVRLRPEAAKLYRYLDLETNNHETDLLKALRSTFVNL